MARLKPAVFFDRDGTLIDIVHRPNFPKKYTAPFYVSELRFKPHLDEVMRELKWLGFLRIMITNQPDVAHGYLPRDRWEQIHQRVLDGIALDDYMMCRHLSEDACPFKKPEPGMLLAMAEKWGIDLNRSYMIGDMEVDMVAGRSAGCSTILINTPYNHQVQGTEVSYFADTLLDAVEHIRRGIV